MPLNNKLLILLLFVLSFIPLQAAERTDSLRTRKPAQTVTQIGASLVLNAGITEGLKHNIHRWRPNREDDHSFPSRHTSWAFTASTILSNEFYRSAPWVPVTAQTLASVVGVQRVAAECHYGTDVIAGAFIGVASTELSYFLGRVIFLRKFNYTPVKVSELGKKVEIISNSTILIPFIEDTGAGVCADAGVRIPFNNNLGCVCELYYLSFPLNGTSAGLTTGISYRHALKGPFELEAHAYGGAGSFSIWGYYGMTGIIAAGVSSAMYLTERFAVTAGMGYHNVTCISGFHCMSVSIGTRARF